MLNIAITGASGFVGRQLCSELVLRGCKVTAFTRDLRNQLDNIDYHMIENIGVDTNWGSALDKVDVLVHLAARVHVMQDLATNPLQLFLDVNLHATVRLAKAASAAGVKRFVYASSIKVNGEFTQNEPFSEQDAANPQDAYAVSKWEAEKALREIEKETGMQVVVLRPPLIYGPNVKANFASLLKLVDKGMPLPLASINNKRSLIYLGNFIDAIINCAQHPKAAGNTYLVSDGEDISMPQLIRKIAYALNRPSRLFSFPLLIMYLTAKLVGKLSALQRITQSLAIDSSKIRQELNWQPPFTIEQGLKETADWYRSQSR
ncbi:MAG: SDR family oxidoreductase [Methylotenera sp.]|nr:SDR family oxidoreductase [Methylotenera sp.]